MDKCDFVIILQGAIPKKLEYLPDALHPERGELDRAQGTDAGAAVNVDTMGKCPEDLLVPHRWDRVEIAVDQSNNRRAGASGEVNITLAGRTFQVDAGGEAGWQSSERGAGEYTSGQNIGKRGEARGTS